jgi:hypothetical protein
MIKPGHHMCPAPTASQHLAALQMPMHRYIQSILLLVFDHVPQKLALFLPVVLNKLLVLIFRLNYSCVSKEENIRSTGCVMNRLL